MATEGDAYAKHVDLLKKAPIVSGAIYLVKAGQWNGNSYPAGSTQSTASWDYYFADISIHTGKRMYYGYPNAAELGGMAFLNVYGQIIKAFPGNGNASTLNESVIEIPSGAHTLVMDIPKENTVAQNIYAYVVSENSKPETLTLIKEQDLTNIANAIRYKLNVEDQYRPSEMAPAIDLIDTDVFLSSFIRGTEPLFAGNVGTCRWEISKKGVLFIHGGELPIFNTTSFWINGAEAYYRWDAVQRKDIYEYLYWSYWYNYRSYIRMIIFDEPVKAQESILGLFNGLDSLWLVLGMENLDTSEVIDARAMFRKCTNLTAVDLSQNDFSKIQYFDHGFLNCIQLREVLMPLNFSSVKSFQSVFYECSLLPDIDLTSLGDGSNLTTIHYTFYNCSQLIRVKDNFSNLEHLSAINYLFYNCKSLKEINCSNWKTSSELMHARSMFYNCSSLKQIDLSQLNISGVSTSLEQFFQSCTSLEEIKTGSGWVFHQTVPIGDWLKDCPAQIDTTYWDVSARKSLKSFFANWKGTGPLNFTYWNTENVEDMSNMFENCSNLIGVNIFNFDMDKVTNMSYMFAGCSNLKWEEMVFFDSFETTSRVNNMAYMFQNCIQLTDFTIPFSTFSVINFKGFLQGCYRLREVDLGNLTLNGSTKDGIPNASIDGTDFLKNCGSVRTLKITSGYDEVYFKSGNSIKFPIHMYLAEEEDIENLDPDNVYVAGSPIPNSPITSNSYVTYYGCGALTKGETFNIRIKNFINNDMSNNKTTYSTVDSRIRKIKFYALDTPMDEDLFDLGYYVAVGDYYNYAGAYAAFDWDEGVLEVFTPERLIFFNSDSKYLFASFTGLTEIDFNDIITIKVEDMSYMFQNCKVLPRIDLSLFNSKYVQNMSYMFSGCTYLEEVDLTPLDLKSCTNINNILEKCNMLDKITFFNKPPIQSFNGKEMFSGCTNLHTFIQPEVPSSFIFLNLQGAFLNCSSLEEIALPQWTVTPLNTCAQMFQQCTSLRIVDISTWEFEPSLIKSMAYMFSSCINLLRVDFPDIMEPLQLTNMTQMFYNCRRLGLGQVGPNGEENYFKLIPIKLKNIVTANANGTFKNESVNATYALAGCECIKTLDLSGLVIELNQGYIPDTTYFLSASSGKDGGYLLDKIIIGDGIEAYFSINRQFAINRRTSPASPDIRYESQTDGTIYYDIPKQTADTYRVIYPS